MLRTRVCNDGFFFFLIGCDSSSFLFSLSRDRERERLRERRFGLLLRERDAGVASEAFGTVTETAAVGVVIDLITGKTEKL